MNCMKNLKAFLVLTILSFTPFVSYSQNWRVNTFDSLQFVVSSPEPLIKKTKESLTEVGKQVVHSFGLKPKNKENLIYQVIVLQYPVGSFPKDSIDLKNSVLSSLIEDTVIDENSDLIYSESTGQQGIKGMQWRIHNRNQIVIRSKAFVFKDRVYIVQVMSEMQKSLNKDVDKFMDSFQFMK